ncbi:YobA family protein [Marinilactibacillus sp. Marseille-P9653]|uniref:YobA family protein n=1 Tax=Marinilactibacillus sp. Marseille-P9653 TaxID=2866583 RepID=UPI001CE3BE04|nr:YobA family protein [Marinilactibacillus sp. Marseille-P9653]
MKLLLLTICSLVLFACQSEGATGEFIAKIISLNENSAVVLAEDLSGYPGGAEISVSLSEGEDWEIGDVVRVEYKGGFMESHPMQIDQKNVEKIE